MPIEGIVDRQYMRERSTHAGTLVLGRLKPGVTIEAARTQMTAIAKRLEHQYPDSDSGVTASVVPLRERLEGDSTTYLFLLLGAVAMVFLIVCINVANMLLARSFARAREMAIRTALGATRLELLTQLLTESLVLAVLGGAVGTLAGIWGYEFVIRLAPWEMRGLVQEAGGFDVPVCLFITGLTLLSGVAFGLAPAWQLSHADPQAALKGRKTTVGTPLGRVYLADALVFIQVTLAVVLLVDAGLLIRSLQSLTSTPTGLRPDRVITLQVSSPAAASIGVDATAYIQHYESLLERVQVVPGIETAAFASALPYTWDVSNTWFFRPDRPLPEPGKYVSANPHVVTPGYFATLGIPLIRGSLFDGHEKRPPLPPGAPLTIESVGKTYAGFLVSAVINKKMAETFWPGEDPIGKIFQSGSPSMNLARMKVIGIVGNTTQTGAENGEPPEYYTLLSQWPAAGQLHLLARASKDPLGVVASLREAIRQADPDETIFDVEPMASRISDFSSDRRFQMSLFTFFAATALLLSAVGVYGVLACLVVQRTREIGIRMALGARHADVIRNVIRRGLRVVLPGVLIGLAAAWASSRFLQSQLFGVESTDLATYAVSGVLLTLAAFLACTLPALRAARVNPVEALRSE
jgi:putative ABC transport system permease protein